MAMAVHGAVLPLLAVVGVLALALPAAESRAVNISNTWVLPEDGFPVFFRYFRDRINWFEADAVCQFHHANLVTVDTGAQFDAARAFLRELDVLSPVWVGLKRGRNQPHFLWTNEQPLSSMGYWNEPLPGSSEELCAAADPAADFRWHGLSCGGLEVASFICELPVPEWAAARDGCMVENLPSLTAAFLPEEAAVELTSDCGLGGTRRVVCKGNTTREALFAQLDCHNMMNEDATLGPGLPSDPEQPEQAEPEDGYTSTSTETSGGSSAGEQAEQAEQTTSRQRRATTTASNAAREATTDVSVDTSVPASSTETSSEPSTWAAAHATRTAAQGAQSAQGHASTADRASSTSRPATAKPAALAAATPAEPARPDTLIVAQKHEPKHDAAVTTHPKDVSAKEVPSWTPDDKAIIVPVVAKKGPGYPKKAPASNAKPFRPEKIPIKLRAPAPAAAKPALDKAATVADVKDAVKDSPATPDVHTSTAVTAATQDKPRVSLARFDVKVSVKKAAAPATPSPRPAQQATVVEVPKVAVDTENKLDSPEFGNHMDANAADDLDDALMIRELSSARTPLIKSLPVVDVPLPSPRAQVVTAQAAQPAVAHPAVAHPAAAAAPAAAPAATAAAEPTAAAAKPNKETPVFLSLPAGSHVVRRPPVKKDGLPAAIAGAAVVTTSTTTTTTAAPTTTSTAAAPTEAASTLSPVRLRESMAGPGGKARTLTTAPPLETAAPAATTASSTPAPKATTTSTSAPTTTRAATSTAAAVHNATAAPHTTTAAAAETSTAAATTSTTTSTARPEAAVEAAPKESGRRRQHLPAPLLSMNMKPDSEGGEEGLETELQSPPRPNRSRSLVHQQHRTFYPYFLNRVLG